MLRSFARTGRFVIASICVIMLLAACNESPTSPTTGTITGSVQATKTSDRIGGALISTEPPTQTVLTSGDGTYTIADAMPGVHTVRAEFNDSLEGTSTVNVIAGKTVSATIVMSPFSASTGTIAGLVRDNSTGAPVQGVEVRLSSLIEPDTTREDGLFRFLNVPDGHLMITVLLNNKGLKQTEADVVAGDTTFVIITVDTSKQETPGDVLALAHYPLNGNVNDISGNGYNGIAEGNPTYGPDRNGTPNSAMYFSSATQRVRVANSDAFNVLPLTMACWIKYDSMPSQNGIFIGKYLHPSGEGYSVFFEGDRLNASYTVGHFSSFARTSRKRPDLTVWTHLAVVYDQYGTTIYINGQPFTTASWSGLPLASATSQDFMFGTLLSSSLTPTEMPGLVGLIDDVRIYHKALTLAELTQITH